jgi:uncharacterized phage-associated protein
MNSLAIAKHIAFKYLAAKQYIDNARIQKILYLLQGYHMYLTGDTLYPNAIYVWKDGPSIPEAYMNDACIEDMAECIDETVEDSIVQFIDAIINETMKYSLEALSALCNDTIPIQFTTVGFVVDTIKIKYFFQSNDPLNIKNLLILI